MENPIVNNDFLLQTEEARLLYHDYAASMPIIDYHCHLNPIEIADNRRFNDLTELWLEGDHYKWRAMRANGISEHYITGTASSWEKFSKWAETVPYTLRNPIYHWTHLELWKTFGITSLLNEKTAKSIYEETNKMLTEDDFSVCGLLKKFNVKKLCTTDDPLDSLEHHDMLKKSNPDILVSMAWRPDEAMDFRLPTNFNIYVDTLEKVANQSVANYSDYLTALKKRHDFFHEKGCRLADHGLEYPFPVDNYTQKELNAIFLKVRAKKSIGPDEKEKLMADLLFQFANWNYEKGWVQQYHIGALRDVNKKAIHTIGKACGFDSIADFQFVESMGKFFNRLQKEGKLTKTIVYNLNPRDNETVATMMGNFQDGSIPGKMQYGSGWWFLDQKDGMENQLNTLSNQGLLSRFVGMVTDSRSFLSYSRHEYFRRVLCNLIGNDISNGEMPRDMEFIGKMVQDICYNNANEYFDF